MGSKSQRTAKAAGGSPAGAGAGAVAERGPATDPATGSGPGGESGRAQSTGERAAVHRRVGWTLLFVALLFGTAVEGLHGLKTASYLLDPLRREMWTLAHFHGVGLGLVNLVYTSWADRAELGAQRIAASRALVAGSVLLPLGFLLGGVAHYDSDPGVGIFLAPAGAALVLYAVGVNALAAWRR